MSMKVSLISLNLYLYNSNKKNVHKKKLEAGECTKECQLKRVMPWEVNWNSYKLSQKASVKKGGAYFHSSKLTTEAALTSHKGDCRTALHWEGSLLLEKVFSV